MRTAIFLGFSFILVLAVFVCFSLHDWLDNRRVNHFHRTSMNAFVSINIVLSEFYFKEKDIEFGPIIGKNLYLTDLMNFFGEIYPYDNLTFNDFHLDFEGRPLWVDVAIIENDTGRKLLRIVIFSESYEPTKPGHAYFALYDLSNPDNYQFPVGLAPTGSRRGRSERADENR